MQHESDSRAAGLYAVMRDGGGPSGCCDEDAGCSAPLTIPSRNETKPVGSVSEEGGGGEVGTKSGVATTRPSPSWDSTPPSVEGEYAGEMVVETCSETGSSSSGAGGVGAAC